MFNVQLTHSVNTLIAEIDCQIECFECAFYLIKDGNRISTRWYSREPAFKFDFGNEPGIYSVVGFVKGNDGQIHSKNSRSVIVSGNLIEVAALQQCELDGPHLVRVNGLDIPIIIAEKKEKRLFVLFSGAVDRSKVGLPVFHRWTWHARFPGTVLCVSDPTLGKDPAIGLGWYIGDVLNNGAEAVAELVRQIAHRQGVSLDRVITYGSSGGGFAALMVTAHLAAGTAVAINCQVDALHYHEGAVRTLCDTCFQGASVDAVRSQHADRVSVLGRWKEIADVAHAVLVQNKGDQFHYNHHYKRIASILGLDESGGTSRNGRHHAFVYDDPSGHGPEPADLVGQIIDCAVRYAQ